MDDVLAAARHFPGRQDAIEALANEIERVLEARAGG
jgi:hypothetical protein